MRFRNYAIQLRLSVAPTRTNPENFRESDQVVLVPIAIGILYSRSPKLPNFIFVMLRFDIYQRKIRLVLLMRTFLE